MLRISVIHALHSAFRGSVPNYQQKFISKGWIIFQIWTNNKWMDAWLPSGPLTLLITWNRRLKLNQNLNIAEGEIAELPSPSLGPGPLNFCTLEQKRRKVFTFLQLFSLCMWVEASVWFIVRPGAPGSWLLPEKLLIFPLWLFYDSLGPDFAVLRANNKARKLFGTDTKTRICKMKSGMLGAEWETECEWQWVCQANALKFVKLSIQERICANMRLLVCENSICSNSILNTRVEWESS